MCELNEQMVGNLKTASSQSAGQRRGESDAGMYYLVRPLFAASLLALFLSNCLGARAATIVKAPGQAGSAVLSVSGELVPEMKINSSELAVPLQARWWFSTIQAEIYSPGLR